MPDIRLQDYTARIKELIQNIHLDEAVAHCQHILRHYPKHIETYCLLGEACLEKELYREAIEFFQRTLGADPENLISRVGLGIIYDEQGSLSEAIWQMERAFELSPGHPEVRRELQRLYAQRDGGEEPRLRLTRGALGRLYSRNGLYDRAIDEFQAVLRQEPDLPDIQVALAEAYWRDGRRVEAADVCTQLLEILPNCLKANLLLGEIWLRGGNEADGEQSLAIAGALDPENLVAQELMGRDSPLPVEEVMIPELEDLSEMPGLDYAGIVEDEELEEEIAAEPVPEPVTAWGAEEDLPEWLRDLGPGDEEPIEQVVSDEEALVIARGEELPPDEEVPEWLQEVMAESPPSAEELVEEPTLEIEVVTEVPDRAEEFIPESEEAEALQVDGEAAPAEELVAPTEERPEGGVPEWLQELVEEEEEVALPEAQVPVEAQSAEAPPEEGVGVPASLMALVEAGLLDEADLESAMHELSEDELEVQRSEEIPEWLRELVGEGEPSAEKEAPSPTEEVPEWVQQLPSRQEVEEELEEAAEAATELEAEAEEEIEIPAETVAEAGVVEEEEVPAEPVAEIAEEELPAWLRDLEAPEAVVEEPEAIAPEPEVIAEAVTLEEEVVEEEEVPAEPVAEVVEEELPAWLRDLEAPEAVVEEPEAIAPEPEIIAEAVTLEEEVVEEEEVPAEPVAEVAEEELPAWLRDLEPPDVTPEPEAVVEEPEAIAPEPEVTAEAVTLEEEVVEEEEVPAEPVAEVAEAVEEELPAWLRDLEAPDVVPEPEVTVEEPEIVAEAVTLDEEVAEEAPARELVLEAVEEEPAEEAPADREEPVVLRDVEAPDEGAVPVEVEPSPAEELLVALKTRPRDYKRRLELARIYRTEQDWKSALNQYEKLISARRLLPEILEDLEPLTGQEGVEQSKLYQLLGDIHMQQDELDKALEMYRLARRALTSR